MACAAADSLALDAPVTERDWHALAWQRLHDVRAKHQGWTLDDALAHRVVGPVVRGYAASLRRAFEADQVRAEKEARYGRKVFHNGYGMAPVPKKFKA